MKLIVEVNELLPENVPGQYQAAAAAAATFKERKFALPVRSDMRIGEVWKAIEERYKKNYLHDAQSS